jgi:xanthine dehydrogenase accessory factor
MMRTLAGMDAAAQLQTWRDKRVPAAFARVVSLEGFSTWSGDELVAINEAGERSGDILGRLGAERITAAGAELLGPASGRTLVSLTIEVQGRAVAEAGLNCGGRAQLLVQSAGSVPGELWDTLAQRCPVALVTRLDGTGAGEALLIRPDGSRVGALDAPADALDAATGLLGTGQTASRQIEDPGGTLLVEAWVPEPRLMVVGAGELVDAITRQGSLLGWETEATDDANGVPELLSWGGGTGALIVLSHDPHLDVPALGAGLAAGVGYVGAMGSRRTQSRRIERLRAEGVTEAELERIHRPIGLDLGGRGAPEVALSICAEILATRSGRDARPLAQRTAPIHAG